MKKFLSTFLLLCWVLTAVAVEPSDSLLSYVKHAMLFNSVYPQEKVYLHFDNTGYFKGEHIWFKAYVTRADQQTPTSVSRVLYVDLLNPSGDVVERRKLRIDNGMAHGDILLDSILGTGFYEVRAYTRYMMNWGGQTAFSRVFPIFRKPAQEGDYRRPTIDKMSIRNRLPGREKEQDDAALTADNRSGLDKRLTVNFYPEGGDLVQGLRSRVAFEVMDGDGRHVTATGVLTDQNGETQAIVRADETGRGLFEVDATPALSQLILTDSNGRKHEFRLPAPKAEGCVVRMDVIDDEGITAQISSTQGMQGRLLGYTVMCGGKITHVDTITAEPVIMLAFKRQSLHPGVNQLTVFTSDGRVQAERLFFVAPTDMAGQRIQIVNQTNEPRPCGLISLDLHAAPNASLSFSAMDERTLTNGKDGNILSYMLLSSDLKGYIPNPDYYLEADDREHRLAADTLMLINGWRRYDWRVMADVEPWGGERQQIEDRLYVFGRLYPSIGALKRKNPVNDVDMNVYLFNETGAHLTGHTRTDSVGNYAFALPDDVMGDWNMQIKTRIEDKLKSYSVRINRHFAPTPRFVFPEETEMMPKNKANLFKRAEQFARGDDDPDNQSAIVAQTGNNAFSIKTVKIKARRRYWTDYNGGWYNENNGRRLAELYYNVGDAAEEINDRGEVIPSLTRWLEQKNNLFHDDKTFDMPDSGGFFNLNGYNYDGRPVVWIVNNSFHTVTFLPFSDKRMEDVVSNAYIPDRNLKSFPVYIDEVKSVYIVSDNPQVMVPYIQSVDIEGSNPVVIFVYTYPSYSTESKKGTRRTRFQGFNVPSTFEMEDYSIMPPMEDFRRTLFWNPDVKTDASGKAHVEFYNNSSAHEMLLSVEGMTGDGTFLTNE